MVPDSPSPEPFEVRSGGVTLRGDVLGEGAPLVLLHGVSATRRNVLQGSGFLARHGYRLIGYDARGHGESSPAPDRDAYGYADLVTDLQAVLDHFSLDRPVLIGSSMGAHTALAWALGHSAQALVLITPAYTGEDRLPLEAWDRLAEALETGGVEGFVEIAQPPDIPERWREATREAIRQRVERHRDLRAVADALRAVPRSAAFSSLAELEGLDVPTLVVGSRDEADALHPLAIAEEYVRRLPDAELAVEAQGESPLAWQGARLSRAIADFLERQR